MARSANTGRLAVFCAPASPRSPVHNAALGYSVLPGCRGEPPRRPRLLAWSVTTVASPGGIKGLSESLLHTARGQARFALQSYASLDDGTPPTLVALSAGAAVESALKAVLAKLLPSTLAEKGDLHTQLFLMGRGGLPDKTYADCRTVGAFEAWKSINDALPKLQVAQNDVKQVLAVRNAAAHLALVDSEDLKRGVRAMVVCVEALLVELGTNSLTFWGDDLHAHTTALVEESVDARLVLIEELKTAARVRLDRLQSLSGDHFEGLAMTLDQGAREAEDSSDSRGESHECPVCHYTGWLSGYVERSALQHEAGDEHTEDSHWVDRTFWPSDFMCGVCGLTLQEEELRLAGLPEVIDLEPDYDPDEYRDWYDDLRDEWERWRD